jgi:hypothetical protein
MRGILREALEGDKGLSSGIGNRFARATGSLGICGNMYLGCQSSWWARNRVVSSIRYWLSGSRVRLVNTCSHTPLELD